MSGEGIDRHLTGLKIAAKELGEEQPELFSDPGYTRPVYHRISSSQVKLLKMKNISLPGEIEKSSVKMGN